jgi:hypothetical protein
MRSCSQPGSHGRAAILWVLPLAPVATVYPMLLEQDRASSYLGNTECSKAEQDPALWPLKETDSDDATS